MPIERERIDQAIPRWAATFRRSSESSHKARRIVTDALRRVASDAGLLYVRDLRRHHFDGVLADLANGIGKDELARRARVAEGHRTGASRRRVETYPVGGPRRGRSEATLVADQRHLRQFVEYCQANGWLANSFRPFAPTGGSVVGGDAPGKEDAPEKRRVVRFNDWDRLLDTAGAMHPRTRILVAVGLYWGRRVSEAAMLQWGHLNLTDELVDRSDLKLSYRAIEIEPGRAMIRNVKRRRTITIPVGGVMLRELDLWKDWVEKADGPVQPEWYVVPPRMQAAKLRQAGASLWAQHHWPVVVDRKATKGPLIIDVQHVLTAFGWRDVRGEGMHTLRRSVAAHLDSIGEIAAAQALLDHMHRATTEAYSDNRAGEDDLNALMARDDPFERYLINPSERKD